MVIPLPQFAQLSWTELSKLPPPPLLKWPNPPTLFSLSAVRSHSCRGGGCPNSRGFSSSSSRYIHAGQCNVARVWASTIPKEGSASAWMHSIKLETPQNTLQLQGRDPNRYNVLAQCWSAANGSLRDGGLSKSADI